MRKERKVDQDRYAKYTDFSGDSSFRYMERSVGQDRMSVGLEATLNASPNLVFRLLFRTIIPMW